MKHLFLVNPISGKADASLHLVPQILKAAKNAKIDYEIELTQKVGHAKQMAQTYAEKHQEIRIYACGGDGTLNEVLEGVYLSKNLNAQAASVPCGSGNDFVRNFGSAEDFLNLADNIAGESIPIDLVKTEDGVSAAICSIGIDAEIAYNIPKYRRLPFCGGSMAYNLSIVERLFRHMGQKLRITIDGTVLEGEYLIATICNGICYGGGYKAAPMANLQDGLLEVILVKRISRLQIANVLPKYKIGAHIENGQVIASLAEVVQYYRAKEINIELLDKEKTIVNIDGECNPKPGLQARVMPNAVRFVLPATLYQKFEGRK